MTTQEPIARVSQNKDALTNYLQQGITLFKLQRFNEAIKAFEAIKQIDPNIAQARLMCGMAYHKTRLLGKAIEELEAAIALEPNNSMVIKHLASTYLDAAHYAKAETLYERLSELEPNNADVWFQLSACAAQKNHIEKAFDSLVNAIEINPLKDKYWLSLMKLLSSNPNTLVTEHVTELIVKQLNQPERNFRSSHQYAEFLIYKSAPLGHIKMDWIELSQEEQDKKWEDESILPILMNDLFISCIKTAYTTQPLSEHILLNTRRHILKHHQDFSELAKQYPRFIELACALGLQCWHSDFILSQTEREKENISQLKDATESAEEIDNSLMGNIITLAMYIPIMELKNAKQIYAWLETNENRFLRELLRVQLAEPLEELEIRNTIPVLKKLEDDVSLKVASQYNEHPYPRWHQCSAAGEPENLNDILKLYYRHYAKHMPILPENRTIDVLVAGCGTGDHAISLCKHYKNSRVIGVDITKASLAYAIRKAREYKLDASRLVLMQADILDLDFMEEQFDVVESAGVLHHMDDPIEGWRIITNRLRPGGLMKIGLYSEAARKSIVAAREEIARLGYLSTTEGIREFREYVKTLPEEHALARLKGFRDFHNTAELRDLAFHVQEHRFTIPQIRDAIHELGLNFIGFSFDNMEILTDFFKRFNSKAHLGSIDEWEVFENENPDTFAGMYQFWLHKPGKLT